MTKNVDPNRGHLDIISKTQTIQPTIIMSKFDSMKLHIIPFIHTQILL